MTGWTPPAKPPDEFDRLSRLARLGVREGQVHRPLEHIAALAAELVGAPTGLLVLVEGERQVFIARHNMSQTSSTRDDAYCAHAISSERPLVVSDARADRRFAGNPATLALGLAYLGVPLLGGPGQSAVGTLCTLDVRPHAWTDADVEQLQRLGALAETYLEGLAHHRLVSSSPLALVTVDATGRCVHASPALDRLTGRPAGALVNTPLAACVIPQDRALLAAMLAHTLAFADSPTRRELRFVRLSGEVVIGGISMAPVAGVPDQVICVIRDVSLERRRDAQAEIARAVRAELGEPLARSRGLARALRPPGAGEDVGRIASALEAEFDQLDGLLDVRLGDVAARLKAEQSLQVREAQLRAVVEHVLDILLVIDDQHRIVDANGRAVSELGWSYAELVGTPLRAIQPAFTEADGGRWFAECAHRAAASTVELLDEPAVLVGRDGRERRVELRFLAVDWNGPGRLVMLARDVTATHERETRLIREREDLVENVAQRTRDVVELQRMEAALKESLGEKETLLKEIHHRVKNNLQIVASLLSLQRTSVPTPEARAALEDSAQRVHSLALVHQHLYGSVSLGLIDLRSYVQTLAETVRGALAPGARLSVDADAIEVSAEPAGPIGLILNELLTNAFKYGGRQDAGEPAQVEVELRRGDGTLTVRVRDHGPGVPAGFSLVSVSSLGLQLVRALTRQLKGRLVHRNEDGAVFELTFPL